MGWVVERVVGRRTEGGWRGMRGGGTGPGGGGLVVDTRTWQTQKLRACNTRVYGVPSVYRRLSQKYQTNRNNKWSLYAVMMVQVRVGDGDSGVAGSDLMRFQTPPWSKLPSRASHKTPTIG